MFISELSIMRRKNLGNYEHKEVMVKLSLTEEDNAELARSKADAFIASTLGETQAESTEVIQQKVEEVKENLSPKKEKKTKAPANKKEKPATAEVVKTYTKDEVNASLIAVAKKFNSKEKALFLIEEVGGVKTLAELPETLYGALIARCEEVANG